MGQPFNVSPPDKQKLYNEVGIGGMISFNRFPGDLDRKTVATGIRNSGGHAFNPKDGTLWFTDNQVDGMGDETPPGELNKMPKMGMWYGHPYYGGGNVKSLQFALQRLGSESVLTNDSQIIKKSDKVIFPGQGAQFSGMGKDLFENSKTACELFNNANEILGFKISKVIFEGPNDDLNNKLEQPRIHL